MAAKKAGLIFTPKDMFQHQTLVALADVLKVTEPKVEGSETRRNDSDTSEILSETGLDIDDLDSILEELGDL